MVRRSVALVLLCIGRLFAVSALASADTGRNHRTAEQSAHERGRLAGRHLPDRRTDAGEPKCSAAETPGRSSTRRAAIRRSASPSTRSSTNADGVRRLRACR